MTGIKELYPLIKIQSNYYGNIGNQRKRLIEFQQQQEPRLLANYAQDENMINAYKQGKDLYATIASHIYHNDYWDNMEHTESGEPNAEGKKRRSSVKGLLLG